MTAHSDAALTPDAARALIAELRERERAAEYIDTLEASAELGVVAGEALALSERLADALEAAMKDRDKAWAANERDRTGYAGLIHSLRQWVSRWSWLREGRGSYEWDDDRWHEEFGRAQREIEKIANRAERKTGATDLSDCPTTTEAVIAARRAQPDTAVSAEALIRAGRQAPPVLCYCGRSGYSSKCPMHGRAEPDTEERNHG